MITYETVNEAIDDLKDRGYTEDFNLRPHGLKMTSTSQELGPDFFEIKEIYRFEGISDPDDNMIVYAIESNNGIKGTLLDAYGAYSDSLTPEMAQKLTRRIE